ncbi:hypothetical protein HR45_12785 [Shewanella mangrovi]|uniref:Uncharacterized protein n=1 Tax=Shewanella mangrovi TaxID=1515746 RepID=A0A094LPL8_9GAMM|nr:hypothetical protein [Shewanella mangrovi]KFZ37103.1 hypothetical protein HR45_12785 [Shewanella mangrovi]
MDLERIAEIIYETAEQEDKELLEIANEGIFHMPELAFVYQCGKSIKKDANRIFGHDDVKWIRELDLKNGGPTDLVFENRDDETLAIEFKMRATDTAYQNDIMKLCRIERPNTKKLFCALIDEFDEPKQKDLRQERVELIEGVKVTLIFRNKFKTIQHWYASQVSCVVCVWLVESI